MISLNIVFTRKEYDLIAKNRGIKEPHKMSIEELLGALSRYDSKRKVLINRKRLNKIKLENIGKKQNISKNELRKAKKLQNKSIDDLKKIAILLGITNYDKLSREDLSYTLLRSESYSVESDYEKYITNDSNDEIKGKINNIRMILSRLGDTVTKNERKKIKKDLYEKEKKERPTKTQKERAYRYLIELANALDKKEEQKHIDRDDLNYFGIRDIQNLFTNNSDDGYYKP